MLNFPMVAQSPYYIYYILFGREVHNQHLQPEVPYLLKHKNAKINIYAAVTG